MNSKKIVSVTLVVVVLVGIMALLLPTDWRWEDIRFVSVLDGVVATLIITLTIILLTGQTLQPENISLSFIALLLAGGVIRFLNSTMENLQVTIWLHRFFRLTLSTGFYLNWKTQRRPTQPGELSWLARGMGTVTVLAACVSLAFPNILPEAVRADGSFTRVPILMSFVSSTIFLSALYLGAIKILSTETSSEWLLYFTCGISSVGSFLFPVSTFGGGRWWVCQLLEILSLGALTSSLFTSNRRRIETTRIKLERTVKQLEQVNEDLTAFNSVAAHDLVEPLRTISLHCELLATQYRDKLGEEGRQYLDFVVDETKRMMALIRALLDYSRIDKDSSVIEKVDCEKLVGKVVGVLKMAIQEQKGEIKIGHLPVIRTDPTLLAQVFQNLIANALKFHKPEQPPIVDISAISSEGKWIFSVHDNGLGIEQKYQKEIFLMFRRLHGKQEIPGSGIGLAACKKIIERLGGQIWLESQPGMGSTFLFSLPLDGD